MSNIWNNPGEIMIDDNVDPEKNKDEIDLSDDEDDDCFKPVETKQEEPQTKPEKDSDSVIGVQKHSLFTVYLFYQTNRKYSQVPKIRTSCVK